MKSVSSGFMTAARSRTSRPIAKIEVGSTRTLRESEIQSFSVSRSLDDSFTLGSTASAKLSMTVLTDSLPPAVAGAVIRAYVGYIVDDAEEFVLLGAFRCAPVDIVNNGMFTSITAYDDFYFMVGETGYVFNAPNDAGTAKMNDLNAIRGVIQDYGYTADMSAFANKYSGHDYKALRPNGTRREVIGQLAAITGTNAIASDYMTISFKAHTDSGITFTANDYVGGSLAIGGDDTVRIGAISTTLTKTFDYKDASGEQVKDQEIEVVRPTDSTSLNIDFDSSLWPGDGKFAYSSATAVNKMYDYSVEDFGYVYNAVKAMNGGTFDVSYRSYSVTLTNACYMEVGDWFNITDPYGHSYRFPVMSCVVNYNGAISTSLSASVPDNSEGATVKTVASSKGASGDALTATFVRTLIADSIATVSADVDQLRTNKADVDMANINDASIGLAKMNSAFVSDLVAQDAFVSALVADEGFIGDLTSSNAFIRQLTANKIMTDYLAAQFMSVEDADIAYAKIDRTNITEEWVKQLMVQGGLIAQDGQFFKLTGLHLNAGDITAGTLTVDHIAVQGADGEYYMLSPKSDGTFENVKLDGSVIQKNSINADRITANSITADQITTNNLVGTGGWINLASGTFEYSNATSGNFIKWDGSKLTMNLDALSIGTSAVATQADVSTAVAGKIDAGTATTIANNAIKNVVWDAELGSETKVEQTAQGFKITVKQSDVTGPKGADADIAGANAAIAAANSAAANATNAAGTATSAATNANSVADAIQAKADNGDFNGADGHSPTVTATKSGTTTTIKVDGSTIATVTDGTNGTTPTITATKSGTVTTIKANGTTIATVNDGANGTTPTVTASKSGDTTTIKVNGTSVATVKDGAAGYTPVKGTDYFTSSEISSIQSNAATAAANSIEVGGRNLLIGSGTYDTTKDFAAGNGTAVDVSIYGGLKGCNSTAAWAGRYIKLGQALTRAGAKVGDKVTLSVWLTSPAGTADYSGLFYLYRAIANSNTTGLNGGGTSVTLNVKAGQWQRLWCTFEVTEYALAATTTRFEVSTAKSVIWAACKLELGNKATDWTPSPEDVDNNISTSVETFTTLVDTTTTEVKEMIGGKVDIADFTPLQTSVAGFDQQITEAKEKAASDLADVSGKIQTQLNNLGDEYSETAEKLDKYLRFDDDWLTIGAANAKAKVRIDNEQISFIDNNQTVAYINGQMLYIANEQILDNLRFGNFVFSERKGTQYVAAPNMLSDQFVKNRNRPITEYHCGQYNVNTNVVAGETYTWSVNVDITGTKKGLAFYFGGGTYIAGDWVTNSSGLASDTYSMTFTATSNQAAATFINVYCSNNAGGQGSTAVSGTCVINWVKLEKGDKATDVYSHNMGLKWVSS